MKTSPGNADVQGSDEQFSDDEHSFFQSFIKHLLSTGVWRGGDEDVNQTGPLPSRSSGACKHTTKQAEKCRNRAVPCSGDLG